MNSGSEEITYPWYSKVDTHDSLQQGDFIFKCQIVQPSSEAYEEDQTISADVAEYDVIVMSQSCDLAANKIELALVCPFYSLVELGNLYTDYKSTKMKEKLRHGHIVGLHLLNKYRFNGHDDYLVVDFKSVYAVPLKFLKQVALSRTNRIRLSGVCT